MDVCAVVKLREVAEEFGVEGRTWAWSNQKVDPLPIKISNTHVPRAVRPIGFVGPQDTG